jgi:hypothetical protein
MMLLKKNKEKIFCIGFNKTGTTTLEKALRDFGYKMGNQRQGELLFEEWKNRNFKPIVKFCQTADAFQDIPFSLPFTFQILDYEFPNAKFILSIRNSAEEWYNSLYKFHAKLFGDGKSITEKDLKKADYIKTGWLYDVNYHRFHPPKGEPYHKETLINSYNNHNYNVEEYFKEKPHKFLKINVSDKDDYLRLAKFLNKKPLYDNFPWLNKTSA